MGLLLGCPLMVVVVKGYGCFFGSVFLGFLVEISIFLQIR